MGDVRDDDRVTVVGSEEQISGGRRQGSGAPRAGVAGGLAVMAVMVLVALAAREPPADTFSPVLPEIPAPGTPPPPDVPAGLSDWRRLDLPGEGGVVAVDGEVRSWAALVADPSPAAWVSTGGARWRYRPLPDDAVLGPESWVEWVGDDLVAVTEAPGRAPPVRAWESADRGGSWRELRSRDAFASLLSGTAATSEGLLLFGSDAGAPAVWRLEDDVFLPMGFDLEDEGRVTSVVDGDRLVAFGHDSSGPAAWSLGSAGWSREPVSTPFDRPVWTFRDVAALPGSGALGVIAAPGFTAGHMVRSSDLVAWELEEDIGMVTAGAIEGGPGMVAVVGDPFQGVAAVALTDGDTWELVAGRSSNLVAPTFSDAGFGSDLVVVGGAVRGRPALWIRGPIPVPRWELPPEAGGGGRWERVASVEWRGRHRVGVLQRGGELFYTADDRVWWIPDLDDPGYVIPAGISGDRTIIGVGGEVFVLGPTSRDGIMVVARRTAESWDPRILWDGWVAGITVVDGEWVAFGESTEGLPVVARSADLVDWHVETLAASDVRPAFHPLSFPGGMLRAAEDRYEISSDGRDWIPLDGRPLGIRGGIPVLDLGRTGPGTTRIRMLQSGARGPEVDVPLERVRYVNRAFESFVAIGDGEVVVERGNGEWERMPLDLLHGVEGSVNDMALAPDGTVLAFEQGGNRLRILRWRER